MAALKQVKASFATAHGVTARAVRVESGGNVGDRPNTVKPVDLVHLSRQSLGDRSLENEILRLFMSQSGLYLDRLENARTADERKMAAHTILGSARGLGAWHVAEQAEIANAKCAHSCDITPLRNAVEQANSYIKELLRD